ncbi:kinectin-like [Anabas testudineus]|uniref:kinectin-like n=1 Tax=Anabas testudineus TaxID=64144 RepID=UPI000E45E4DA|nr:kinectin-like [Anabas testudineus]
MLSQGTLHILTFLHICFLILDDFYKLQSSSSAVTIGLAVSLAVCILFILLLAFFLWKMKYVRKFRRCQCNESNEGEMRNIYEVNETDDQIVTEDEQVREQLMEVVHKGKVKNKSKHREGMEKSVKEELETKKKEVKKKQAELQQLQEENQSGEKNLQILKNQLENKNKELKTIKAVQHYWYTWHSTIEEHQKKITEAEREVESLKKQLKTTETKIKEIKNKQAEIQKLQEDIKEMETDDTEV